MSIGQKWRGLLKYGAVAVSGLLIFAFGLFALNGRSLASTLFGDVFFAVAFSLIPGVIGYPILVGIGFLFCWITERLMKRRLSCRIYVPWLVPAIVGVGCVAWSFLLDRSPRTVMHDFPNIDPPASLSNFQYWWDTLPGDTLYVFSFDVDPSEFKKLLAGHKFVEDSDPADISKELNDNFLMGLPGLDIQLPRSPLVTVFKYSNESPPGLPHIIDVFTNANRNQVVICGDN